MKAGFCRERAVELSTGTGWRLWAGHREMAVTGIDIAPELPQPTYRNVRWPSTVTG